MLLHIPRTDPSKRMHPLFQFGDGIMSMIDCKVHVERKPDPKGDRVVLTFE